MASGARGSVLRQVERLFHGGAVAGLAEAQLLDQFLDRRDEAAFEALLARHGPMVLGVCRRLLRDEHDIEDAFQAIFLVLVRRARSIRDRDRLGPWLYGVALRVAGRARARAVRRQGLEREVSDVPVEATDPTPADEADRRALRDLLDEELSRLPARFRVAVVLCDLEGQSQDEVARQLGCPLGTVKSRLARGRDQLRRRLGRRGIALSTAALGAYLNREASAAIPTALKHATAHAACRLLPGPAAAALSAPVAALLNGAIQTMSLTHILGAAGATILIAGAVATGAAVLAQPGDRTTLAQVSERPEAKKGSPSSPQIAKSLEPEGKPLSVEEKKIAAQHLAARNAQTQMIRKKLDEGIEIELRDHTLSEFLKAIKAASQGPGDNGIPIYVDPAGLMEAHLTMESPVAMIKRSATVRQVLNEGLRPLGLSYIVRDGLLAIDTRTSILEDRLDAVESKLDRILEALEARPNPTHPQSN